jgi:hypothetical protein
MQIMIYRVVSKDSNKKKFSELLQSIALIPIDLDYSAPACLRAAMISFRFLSLA